MALRIRVPNEKARAEAAQEAASWRALRPKGMSGRQWKKMRKAEKLLTPKKARRGVYDRLGVYAAPREG